MRPCVGGLGAAHWRHLLHDIAHDYNRDRNHLALGKGEPVHRVVERQRKLKSRKVLGGLHQSPLSSWGFRKGQGATPNPPKNAIVVL